MNGTNDWSVEAVVRNGFGRSLNRWNMDGLLLIMGNFSSKRPLFFNANANQCLV